MVVTYIVKIMRCIRFVSHKRILFSEKKWGTSVSCRCRVDEDEDAVDWFLIETSYPGCQDSLLVRVPGFWSKGCEFESRQEWQKNFLLQSQLCMLTVIQCLFHPCVTAVARKRPRSFCQKCRWQVPPKDAYTLDPMKLEWADYAAVQAWCGILSGNELACSLSHCGLILS